MRKVVLRTQRHKALLAAWGAQGRGKWVREVMALLCEAAMRENAVYRHAPKLRLLARGLRETPRYRAEEQALKRFLRDNERLHMDGYVRFRMGWYAEMLDMLSYRLIKKLRATARGD